MYTEKYRKFQALEDKVKEVMENGHQGCMVCCGGGAKHRVERVVEVLREFNLNLDDIRNEMRTLVADFDFVEDWRERKPGSNSGCFVYFRLFLMACYKYL